MEKIQMTLTVTAEQALRIAKVLSEDTVDTAPAPQVQQSAPIQNAPTQNAPVQAVPISRPTPAAAPIQPAPAAAPTQPAAPVAQPCTYTIGQIQAACAPLMDAGKQAELVGLLAQFGVQSLPQLSADQLGPFATALRGLGAKI